jgi:hypothetical protein
MEALPSEVPLEFSKQKQKRNLEHPLFYWLGKRPFSYRTQKFGMYSPTSLPLVLSVQEHFSKGGRCDVA